jgi:hypothetical protein
LRDNGLYHNTYSEQELKDLAFQLAEDPVNAYEQIVKWAGKIYEGYQAPARFYGAIEDASKTIIARYALDNGGTAAQAVKFADKVLFDYGQTSEVVGTLRRGPFPFITWSAKVLPRLVETAIRKPEKYIMVGVTIAIWNAIARSMLGIDKDDEEKLKPDYIRGKSTLLMPRDINGDLNWVDLTYFLPWGSWMPIEKGKLAIPQTLTMGNPLLTLYYAYVLNYDPFYGEIAPGYLTDEEALARKNEYIFKSLAPALLTTTPNRILTSDKPDKYGRKKELGKILSGELAGVKFITDTSAYRGKIQQQIKRKMSEGISKIKQQVRMGEISREEAKRKIEKLQDKFRKERSTH